MQIVMASIRAIRNIRAEFNLSPAAPLKVIMVCREDAVLKILAGASSYIKDLAKVGDLELTLQLNEKPRQAVSALLAFAEVYVPLEGLIDVDKEIARLQKDLNNIEAEITKADSKLSNDNFLAKAPPEVIAKEQERQAEARLRKEGIIQRMRIFKPE